jgi:hypothetical protein
MERSRDAISLTRGAPKLLCRSDRHEQPLPNGGHRDVIELSRVYLVEASTLLAFHALPDVHLAYPIGSSQAPGGIKERLYTRKQSLR